MKLNNQQINAIIEKAFTKRSEESKALKEKAVKSKEASTKKLAASIQKEISGLSKEAIAVLVDQRYALDEKRLLKEDDIVNSLNKAIRNSVKSLPDINRAKLRNDIILESINSADLQDLCKKLKIEI